MQRQITHACPIPPDVRIKDFEFTSKTATDPIDWAALAGSDGSCWKENAPGCGYTGWLLSEYSFALAGQYRIEIGVTIRPDRPAEKAADHGMTRSACAGGYQTKNCQNHQINK